MTTVSQHVSIAHTVHAQRRKRYSYLDTRTANYRLPEQHEQTLPVRKFTIFLGLETGHKALENIRGEAAQTFQLGGLGSGDKTP